jgi:transcriptional regulator with GAF, ATPase, and Fis domain
MRLSPGSVLEHRYLIKRQLGEGGMGTAYLADDLLRGSPVALKLLRVRSPDRIDAFRTEFLRLRRLVHPHLCQVHDFGATRGDDGRIDYFYSAEYVEGQTLDGFAEGRTWAEIAGPFAQALDALRLLHELKLRHGDVKPANILVDGRGRAVLIDLSCSQPIGEGATAVVSGTPGFIAPEVRGGKTVDHRADLYGVGATLHEIAERLRSGLPDPVQKLVRRLLQKKPADRPADVGEVLDELSVFVAKTPVPPGIPARLLGRSAELDQFRSMLDALIERREGMRCLFFVGPEGTGKTRLLQEMKWAAELRCAVVEGHPVQLDPITSMLRRATGDASITGDLAGLLQARELLVRASSPMVLIVDDAHRLSGPELEMLHGLIRSIEPTDPYLVLCAGVSAPSISSVAVRTAPLAPLAEVEVAAWTRGIITPKRLPDVMRLTGGFPASVHALLSLVSAGDCTEQELSRLAGKALLSNRQIEAIRALDREPRRALGLFAVCHHDEALDVADLADLGITRDTLSHLLHRGFIQAGPAGFRLARSGEAARILEALDPKLSTSLHGIAAGRVRDKLAGVPQGSATASELTARLVEHLFLAGNASEATRLFLESRSLADTLPAAWTEAAQTLAKARPEPAVMLRAAEIHEAADMPDAALSLVTALLRSRPGPAWLGRIRLRAGASYFKRGDMHKARGVLARAIEAESDPEVRARAIELMSRAHIRSGAYAKAIEDARRALADCENASVKADLYADLGLAATYLGDTDAAREHYKTAAMLHEQTNNPQGQILSVDRQAFNEYRAGHTAAAANGYRQALELAERFGTSHQIARAVHNYATACHQKGDLGEALAAYVRALRATVALGRTTTEVTLRYNLAKLYADIGLFERAEGDAHRAARIAREAEIRLIVGCAEEVLGEVALARGEPSLALERFEAARREYVAQAAAREAALVELLCAEARLLAGDTKKAAQALGQARRAAQSLRADDVLARTELLQAKVLVADNEAGAALSHIDEAHRLAQKTDQRWFQAKVEQVFAEVYEKQGSSYLAERHRTAARELWERTAATLPKHLKETFWSHPARAGLAGPEEEDEVRDTPRSPSARERKLERLLDINKKLNSSLDTKVVLNYTIDSAIELTESERGFVILKRDGEEDGELFVAVARNIDQQKIGKSHASISRGIAERVILTGAPLVTGSAQADVRLVDRKSVHALRLESVICVPIGSAGGVLGALYLDNRFRRALFGQEDIDLLGAFADQAAIALTNARLHAEIARRNAELQEKQSRIEELLRGKDEEIDRLKEQVIAKDPPHAYRHDYSDIVGRAPAMQAVLDKLDPVIDKNFNVVIQGESGTGKELFARAIHAYGPHKKGRFVALNCGTVPESLLEAELFGAKKGAYTDLKRDRPGLMVKADKGTLFLDEVGEMPPSMQVKLLRALQEREVVPVGGDTPVPIDIRLVCATNRSLRDEVLAGRFRKDLFHRIDGLLLELPPLRERASDIPEIARHILERMARAEGRPAPKLAPSELRRLMAHPWEGNVRELENVLTKAFHMTEGETLARVELTPPSSPSRPDGPLDRRGFEEEEAESIKAALKANRWNVSETCRALGIPRATFYRKLHRYGIEPGEAPASPQPRTPEGRPRGPAKGGRRSRKGRLN